MEEKNTIYKKVKKDKEKQSIDQGAAWIGRKTD